MTSENPCKFCNGERGKYVPKYVKHSPWRVPVNPYEADPVWEPCAECGGTGKIPAPKPE